MARHVGAAAALVAAAVMVSGCASSVAGRAVRAPGQPGTPAVAHVAISAHDLLLADGDTTPFGTAAATSVGDNYFTSARPPECSAALLFKGSPLVPPGSAEHAESAYRFGAPALYAESIDVYDKAVKPHDVVSKGFAAIAKCHGEAVGVSPTGVFPPMRLNFFGATDDGVLVWTMTHPKWTCDYGLAVLPRVALMLSACDSKPGFPMKDWASKRRAQIDRRTA
jgi:hypothetical protein